MKAYVDGSLTSVCCVLENGGTVVCPIGLSDKRVTTNEAEYLAVLLALDEGFSTDITEILSDSQLVVRQLNREYHIKEPRLRELAIQVWNKAAGRDIKFTWIPREENPAGKVLG